VKARMRQVRDWQEMLSMSVRLREERTGVNEAVWNRRIRGKPFKNEPDRRAWQ